MLSVVDTINKSQSISLKSIQWRGQPHTYNKIWFSTALEGCTGSFRNLGETDVTHLRGWERMLGSTTSRNPSHNNTHTKYIKMLTATLLTEEKKMEITKYPSTEEN